MKYSYSWLKKISKTNISPEKMAELLMMHSFEVEGIEKKGQSLDNVIVGQIKEINKHPNADKLSITKVFVGKNIQNTKYKIPDTLTIVCGASNIKVGDKVPVALIGAKLPGMSAQGGSASGGEIKEAEIRGAKSFGMLCAEDELGLGKDHSGILILEQEAKVGEEITKMLELEDTIIELDILSNRGHDALSHVGVAREVAALNNGKIDPYYSKLRINADVTRTNAEKGVLKVEIEAKDLCLRYIGVVMTNIKVKESPGWVKNRLRSLGINPINNVVDATNFVMLELGQPLHAFDLEKISGMEAPNSKHQILNKSQISSLKSQKVNIIVRRAENKEKITLLDGSLKELSRDDLVIANEKNILALAGIMGGIESGISENTKAIVLEAANFNATNIRRSRTRLGLKTDASDRYEKDIDPNLCEMAMARVAEIVEFFGGKTQEITDVYPKPIKPWKIKLDLEYVSKLLGEKIQGKQAIKILNSLELPTSGTGKIISVTVPTFRIDLKTQEDLIEEIGRIYGYEKIKSAAPVVPIKAAKINENREFEKRAKNILAGLGFSEVYNYSFYSSKDAETAGLSNEKHLELENPMNPDQALLRVSLVPGILKNIRENLKNFSELHIFEIGKIFHPARNATHSVAGGPGKDVLPEEKNMLACAMVLEKDKKAESFFELKGFVDSLLGQLGIAGYYFDEYECSPEESPLSLWHPGRCSNIKIEGSGKEIGYLGEISPVVSGNFGINGRVVMFEFDMEKLRVESETEREFVPLRKYPLSTRDISMIAPGDTRVDDILEIIQKSGGNIVIDADLFDIFDFEEKGETSFAFHIYFGADDRTLKNEEIDNAMKKITGNLEKELDVKIRK